MSTTRSEAVERRRRLRRFWITFGVSSTLGFLYPASVVLHLGRPWWADAKRWIVNDPGFVVHLCLLLPVAAGVLAASMDIRILRSASRGKRLALGFALVGLLVAAFTSIFVDLGRKGQSEEPANLEPPIRFREFQEALVMEKEIRSEAVELLRKVEAFRRGKIARLVNNGESTSLEQIEFSVEAERRRLLAVHSNLVEVYKQRFPGLRSRQDVWEFRGGSPAKVALVLNGYAAFVLGLLFWYLIAVVVIVPLRGRPQQSHSWIWLFIGIETLWIPLRIYSEWYRKFGLLESVVWDYPMLVFILLVLAVAFVLSVFINSRGLIPRVLTVLLATLSYLTGLVSVFNPTAIGGIGTKIVSLGIEVYCLSLAIFGLALVAMAYSVVRDLEKGE